MAGKFFDNIVIILMENHGISDIIPSATFMTQLANQNALANSYSAVDHPSEGNYVVLISGDDYGFTNDCGYCPGRTSVLNIIDRLEAAGLTWKGFAEDASSSGTPQFQPPRGTDHFAFPTFNANLTSTRARNYISVNGSNQIELLNELNSTTPSNYIWFTPTDNHNMHDNSVSSGDAYLSVLVPQILNSTTFKTKRAVLIILFDEGNNNFPNDYVYFVAVGPVAKKTFVTNNQYSHFSFLHTIEDNWGLSTLTANDAGAPVMSDLFGASAPPTLSTSFAVSINPTVGLPVTLTSITTGGTPPYVTGWDFGDGTTGTGIIVTHIYNTTGNFNIVETVTDSVSAVATFNRSVTINLVGTPPPPNLVSWHPAVTEIPTLITIAQAVLQPITFTTPNKRALPPSITNSIQAGPGAGVAAVPNGFFFEIDNVTVQGVNPSGDGEAFTFNGVFFDDTDIDVIDPSLPAGQLQGIHCQADMNWKLNGLTSMTDYPRAGDIISIQGYSYYDPGHIGTNLGNGREFHALTAWKDSAGIIHMIGSGVTPPPPPPPPPSGLAPFNSSDWSIGPNVGGSPTVGSVSVDNNGVLQTRESTLGGDDNNYGYATAQRGSFPWAPNTTAGTALPSGITRIQTQANILVKTFLSGHSRQHTYAGLYYRCSAAVNGWFDTQVRLETIDGVDSPAGKTETYLPGDSSGFDIVQTSPVLDIDTELQFQMACNAYGIDPATPHTLDGIEIGTEGFLVQELDVDWPGINILTGTLPPPPPPPRLATSFTNSPISPIVGQNVTFTASPSGGSSPYINNWDFGDASTSTGTMVTHSYNSTGIFNVILSTVDSVSQSALSSKLINVTTIIPPPTGSTTYSLIFDGFDFDGGGECVITVNGTRVASLPSTDIPANGQVFATFNVNITKFIIQGFNTVKFTHANFDCAVNDNLRNVRIVDQNNNILFSDATTRTFNCVTSVTYTFTLGAPPPPPPLTAVFNFSPLSPNEGQAVTFTALPNGGTPPYTYAWLFGDTASGTGQSATHSYAVAGTYTVSLNITDSTPTSVTITKTIGVITTPIPVPVGTLVDLTGFNSISGAITGNNDGSINANVPRTRSLTISPVLSASATVNFKISGQTTTTVPDVDGITRSGITIWTNVLDQCNQYFFAWRSDNSQPAGTSSIGAHKVLNPGLTTLVQCPGTGFTFLIDKATNSNAFKTVPIDIMDGVPHSFQVIRTGNSSFQIIADNVLIFEVSDLANTFSDTGTFGFRTDNINTRLFFSLITGSLPPPPSNLAGSFTSNIPVTVVFNSNITGGTPPYTINWDFGDSTIGTGANISHTYNSIGMYTVTMTVIDSNNVTTGSTRAITFQ